MKSKWGFLLSAKSAAIVVLFFLPFVNVSCSGMVNVPLTGMELATGKLVTVKEPFSGKVKTHNVEAEPFAAIALGSAALGLLFGFFQGRFARVLNALAGASGIVFLLLLKNKFEQEVLAQGGGMIVLHYEIGFWASMLLFALCVLAGLYAAARPPAAKETAVS